MTFEIALIFLIILLIIILFAFEVFPMDKIAFCIIGVLILFGLVTPEEGISGFSNSAVITILCLMIIAAALEQNGVISWMASGLKQLKGWPIYFIVPAFMFITGSISAFISSTAVVLVFTKVLTELSDKYDISKSKLLLPISFASILGGSCTLMGTSTNLIVNSIFLERSGERFAFFEFTWLGIIFLTVAILLTIFLVKYLPTDSPNKLRKQYEIDNFITTLEISLNSKLIGKNLKDTFFQDSNISVLKFSRNDQEDIPPKEEIVLQEGDRLMLSCDLENLLKLKSDKELIVLSTKDSLSSYPLPEFKDDLVTKGNSDKEIILVEMMIMPGARFLGMTLSELKHTMLHDAIPLAIKKRKNLRFLTNRLFTDTLSLTRLKVGDRVLLEVEKDKVDDFELYDNVMILQQYRPLDATRSSKRNLTLIVLLGVIVLAASSTLSILTSTIFGCIVLLLFNCITLENVYKKINWQILFLLAGMIPMGIAMHNTGADDWLSDQLLNLMHGQNQLYAIGLLFSVTMLLSAFVSNNATAIIMTPLAISIATGMQLPLKPFVLAVMFGSNFSFFTPIGYQTNSLIYSMGIYKFKHFMVVGGIISLIILILGTLLLAKMA